MRIDNSKIAVIIGFSAILRKSFSVQGILCRFVRNLYSYLSNLFPTLRIEYIRVNRYLYGRC